MQTFKITEIKSILSHFLFLIVILQFDFYIFH